MAGKGHYMNEYKILFWFVFAVICYFIVFVGGTYISLHSCGHLHSPGTIICSLSVNTPELAGVFGGVVFGWKRKFIHSLFGVFIPLVSLVFIWMIGQLSFWFGSDLASAFIYGTIDFLLPAFLSSVTAACISQRKLHNT